MTEVSRMEKREAKKKMMKRAGMQWVHMLTLSLWMVKRLLKMSFGVV